MVINNASNFLLYGTCGLPELKNPKFKKVAVNVSAVSGNQDLYTVPVGKRVLVLQMASYFNANIVVRFTVRSSGNYYNIDTSSNPGNVFTQISYNGFCVILPGETIAFNTASSVSGNLTLSFIEYDEDSQLNRGALFSLSTGDNTVYTCPAGYQAIPVTLYVPSTTFQNGNLRVNYFNASGTTRTLSFYYVPSGGSPGSTNLTWSGTIANNAETSQLTNTSCFPALQAGDSCVVNTDSNASGQYAWVNVIERKL